MVVHQIKSKAQLEAALEKYKIVVVECYIEKAMACRLMAPFNRRLSEDHTKAYFLKVDVEKEREIGKALNFRATPSFIIFKDGKRINHIVGMNRRGLEMSIIEAIKTEVKDVKPVEEPKPTDLSLNCKLVEASSSNLNSPSCTAIEA